MASEKASSETHPAISDAELSSDSLSEIDSDYDSEPDYRPDQKYTPKFNFPVYSQRVVDGLVDLHPKASFTCWFISQIIGALVVIEGLTAIIYITPFLLEGIEWRTEQLKFEAISESVNEVDYNRQKFASKLENVFNQTTPTTEDLTTMVEDFVQYTYIDTYIQNNEDVDYINDNADTYRTWNYNNALGLLVSAILLTGTSEMKCSNVTCNAALALMAVFGLIFVTVILSSSVFVLMTKIRFFWAKILNIRVRNQGALFTKRDVDGIIVRDFFVMCTSLAIFIGAFILAILIVHKDQLTWSWSQTMLFVYGQTTTVGRTRVVPDFISSKKVTITLLTKYTAMTIWCVHYFALFLASAGSVYKSWHNSRYAVLDQEDYQHLLKVDAKMRNMRAEKAPQYLTN